MDPTDPNYREGYTPPTRREDLIATAKIWTIYAGVIVAGIGIFWVAFHLPPGVAKFLTLLSRLFGAFG